MKFCLNLIFAMNVEEFRRRILDSASDSWNICLGSCIADSAVMRETLISVQRPRCVDMPYVAFANRCWK